MRVGILGAGSLGLLFAARLSAVCSVEVITRTEEQADAIRARGISVEAEGNTSKLLMEAMSYERLQRPGEQAEELDYLFLMVKQSAVNDLLAGFIGQRVSSRTKVICFQNGIGHVEQLLQILHPDQVRVAVTTEAARRLTLTSVAHTGTGITYLDEMEKNCGLLLEKAGFKVSLSNNMVTRVWGKLIVNSVINPLTAILHVRNGELLQSPHTQALMTALYQEGISVTKELGIEMPEDGLADLLQVCERTAGNHSSMLQDLMNGKATEIESINGSLLRIAQRLNLSIPVNFAVYHLVKALEKK